jgi:succinate-semialdehyde dehydrogenase / glutarate-semialdehyde dehydrogenase
MRRFEMGDPNDPKTVLGPMGGEAPKRVGAWFPATILTNVLPGQAAHDEELFGPVAAVISAKVERDAIRIVNASEFGRGSAVITADTAHGERIASEELDAGAAFVNQNVRSDPRLPFGGVKNSGYGREVSEFGIRLGWCRDHGSGKRRKGQVARVCCGIRARQRRVGA